MAKSTNSNLLPEGYVPLPGSERRPSKDAKLIGPADDAESFFVTIVLRRRADGPPLPDFDFFAKTPPGKRKGMGIEEFTAKYGAHPDDLEKVVKFAEKAGLNVVETHAGRRTVVVSGTAADMSAAFAVSLGRYEHTIERHRRRKPYAAKEVYRGRDGFINVPKALSGIIVGVFGLDNRTVSRRSSADPPNTSPVTVQQVARLYNYPANSAAGQTIGIISTSSRYGGYFKSDIDKYFNGSPPIVTPVSCIPGVSDTLSNGSVEVVTTVLTPVGGTVLTFVSTAGILPGSYPFSPSIHVPNFENLVVTAVTPTTVILSEAVTAVIPAGTPIFFNPDGETTQDICIATAAAPGANIAVYFSDGGQSGWISSIVRAVIPSSGDPACSVLSSSWYISGGDDPFGLALYGVTASTLTVLSAFFHDAAILFNLTICICSADFGSSSDVGRYITSLSPLTYGGDGKAHVIYPASDPWVLAVGGTTMGNIGKNGNPLAFDEYVWNDPDPSDPSQWGTTGGGVSDFFGLPSYQAGAGVPKSVNDHIHVGRGVPDVAGNASYNSGYSGLFVAGQPDIGNGTSASTPHWAGLIALINAALGRPVGFINPAIYQLAPMVGAAMFRDINPPADGSGGPTNNSNNGIAGYTAGQGWDACTGWGSPNGRRLLAALGGLPLVATVIASGGKFANACLGTFTDEILTINNSGFGLLAITDIISNSPDFQVPFVASYPLTVGPGNSIDITVRFQPLAAGIRPGLLTVQSNDPTGSKLIPVFGDVPLGKLTVTGSPVFGGVKQGRREQRILSVCNTGSCMLNVSQAAFQQKRRCFRLLNNPFPAAIRPGSSLDLAIEYKADEKVARSCELVITSDDPTDPARSVELVAYTIWDCACDCGKEPCAVHSKPCNDECCEDKDGEDEC